jgi:hypothetical protein
MAHATTLNKKHAPIGTAMATASVVLLLFSLDGNTGREMSKKQSMAMKCQIIIKMGRWMGKMNSYLPNSQGPPLGPV